MRASRLMQWLTATRKWRPECTLFFYFFSCVHLPSSEAVPSSPGSIMFLSYLPLPAHLSIQFNQISTSPPRPQKVFICCWSSCLEFWELKCLMENSQVLEEEWDNGSGSRETDKVLVRPLALTLFISFYKQIQNITCRKCITSLLD